MDDEVRIDLVKTADWPEIALHPEEWRKCGEAFVQP